MVVSIPDQKLALYTKGELTRVYDVSTSKFAVSCRDGTFGTPLGHHEIAQKIGDGQPAGMKFKNRTPTGEVVAVNAPGRDPIVSRILWLTGTEADNRNTHERCIYIHGTPEERNIGRPASYGCIRMRSKDVIELYDFVGKGASVNIVNAHLPPPPEESAPTQVALNAPSQASPATSSAATSAPATAR